MCTASTNSASKRSPLVASSNALTCSREGKCLFLGGFGDVGGLGDAAGHQVPFHDRPERLVQGDMDVGTELDTRRLTGRTMRFILAAILALSGLKLIVP